MREASYDRILSNWCVISLYYFYVTFKELGLSESLKFEKESRLFIKQNLRGIDCRRI